MRPKYNSMQERIIANSVRSDDHFYNGTPCWVWIGAKNSSGYGALTVRRDGKETPSRVLAHRTSYEAFVGPIPDGLVIKHLCNNKMCVAPLHLEPDTQSENMKQCVRDGRRNGFRKAA